MSPFAYFRLLYLALALPICAGAQEYTSRQSPDWPVTGATGYISGKIYNAVKVQYGTIFLKNNDTLKGRLKLLPYFSGDFRYIELLPAGKSRARDILMITRVRIDHVRTYPDSTYTGTGYTDFVNLDDKDLWRVLAKKGDIGIYDDHYPGWSKPFGGEMIIVGRDKKKWVRIYRHVNDAEDIAPALLKFINKRYQAHFRPEEFKDEWAMIHYILDKEAK